MTNRGLQFGGFFYQIIDYIFFSFRFRLKSEKIQKSEEKESEKRSEDAMPRRATNPFTIRKDEVLAAMHANNKSRVDDKSAELVLAQMGEECNAENLKQVKMAMLNCRKGKLVKTSTR